MKEMVRSGSFLRFALGQHLGSHLELHRRTDPNVNYTGEPTLMCN